MAYLTEPNIFGWIKTAAANHNLLPETIAAIIDVESGWNPEAIGDHGHSFGLMQLNDQGAGWGFSASTLLDPAQNIRIGTAYFARCLEATGDTADAISAYNQGISGWEIHGKELNKPYVDAVLERLHNYVTQGLRARIGGEILCAFSPFP